MTEQEQKAIKWMKNVRDGAVVTLDHIAKEEPNVSPMLYAGRKEKAETIINGFEELEKYRAIGTVEECKNSVLKILEAYNKAVDDFETKLIAHLSDWKLSEAPFNDDETDRTREIICETIENAIGAVDEIAEQLKGGDGE